jgi:LysM repeat protein
MRGTKRKLTLMPLVALAGLSLAFTLPALSSTVHAAPPVAYATVTVQPGQTLWALAEQKTAPGGDVQATVDQIIAVNHLAGADLTVGQTLTVPAKAL